MSPSGSPAAVPRRTAPVARILTVWLASSATLLLLGALLPDVQVEGAGAALTAAALLGLLNAFVWPLLLRLALPLTVLTLGFGVLIFNGAMVLLLSQFNLGLHVTSLWSGIVVTLAVATVTTLLTSVLAIDDDDFWYRNVVRRQARREAPAQDPDCPGPPVPRDRRARARRAAARAARRQRADACRRWMRDGTHRLPSWETDWSSQTGACQAGTAARQQRRHARLPLVGEGPRRGDRHQPSARRGRARAPPLRRARAAARRRREPREHPLRRRAALAC